MTAGVCTTCFELVEGGSTCTRCGGKVGRKKKDWAARDEKVVADRIAQWRREGLIDENLEENLLATQPRARTPLTSESRDATADATADAKGAAPAEHAASIENAANRFESGASALFGEIGSRWKKISKAIEEESPPSEKPENERAQEPIAHDDRATEAGRAIFARGGERNVVGAGVEALSALDDDHEDHGAAPPPPGMTREEARPLGAQGPHVLVGTGQVFWFIGTILVLAGSVMGVREAWRTLEGVWRPVVIAGAMFGYHVLFVGLSRLLAKRSETTGRVLAIIASGLLPIVFVAAAVAIGQERAVGMPFAGVLLLASLGSMFVAGRSAEPRALGSGFALAIGLAPSLLLELVIGGGGAPTPTRGLVVLLGLVPVAIAATRTRFAISATSVVALAGSAYGALAVGILGLYGGPGDPALSLDTDPIAQCALVAWLACGSTVAWWATSGTAFVQRYPKVGIVPIVVSLAVLVSTSAAALIAGLNNAPPTSPLVYDTISDAATVAADNALAAQRHLAAQGSLAVLFLATAVLAFEQRTRRGAIHVAILTATAAALLAARIYAPLQAELWPLACAAVPALALLLAAIVEPKRRAILATWGVVHGLVTLFVVLVVEGATRSPDLDGAFSPWWISTTTAAGLAIAAHVGARTTRPSQHLAGALFAYVAGCAWRVPSAPPLPTAQTLVTSTTFHSMMMVAACLAGAYGVLALGYEALAKKDDDRRPLDDASLLLALAATWAGVLVAPRFTMGLLDASNEPTSLGVAYAIPSLALAAALLVRSLRDKSALVVLHAAIALALAAHTVLPVAPGPYGVWLTGGLAAAFAVPAAFRAPRREGDPRFGRAIFGVFPLPLGGGLRSRLDGFAIASLAMAVMACLCVVPSFAALSVPDEAVRPAVLAGLAGVLATAVAAFVTRAFDLFNARGHVATLWLAGPVIGLTAVSYRMGRPLPPDVVGFRLSIVIAVVWALARFFVWVGPKIARGLERPAHGDKYHHVVHGGVLALALLLFVDALLVGGPTPTRFLVVTPPLLLAGAALGFFLLYRSYGLEPLLHLGVLALASAAMLAVAHGHVLGPTLLPLDIPGGRWVPAALLDQARVDWLDPLRFIATPDTELALWNRGWLGLACATAFIGALLAVTTRSPRIARFFRSTLFARTEEQQDAIERGLAIPHCLVAVVVSFGLAWQPTLVAALAFAAAAALAAAGRSPAYRFGPIVLALPIALHAVVHVYDFVPAWAGPAFAALSLVVVLGGRAVSARADREPAILLGSQGVAFLAYAPMAIAYALAAEGAVARIEAAPRILDLASNATLDLWLRTYALAATLVVLALAYFVATTTWRGALAKALAIGPPVVLGIAALAGVVAFVGDISGDASMLAFTREGALLGAGIAAASLVAHVTAFVLHKRGRDDVSYGLTLGRDVVLVVSAVVMCLYVAIRVPGGWEEGPCGIAALGLAVIVSLHAISWQGTARHVALVEALLVAFYAFATRSLRLRPEIDAMVGLLYGFSLLGVAVVARRRGVPKVADATRRFAAVLPLALALLTTNGMTNEAAGLALGTSVLYGAMAWVERSRIFGSLAALAANLALVVFAIAQGLDGIEVFVGPLGILVTALAQIFAPKTSPAARSALRIIGGALLYLPAGVKLTFRLGEADDATYSVVFGAVCLIGVVAGLALRVRAYLALGTLFLVLDVIANLVHAGLRDHRIGFVLLSATGLSILGIMIFITLRRDRAWAFVGRLRSRVRAWD